MAKSLAIVGSRNFQPMEKVRDYVNSLPKNTKIFCGGVIGVDQEVEKIALERYKNGTLAFAPIVVPKRAVEAAEELVAFWDGTSTGTKSSITKAKEQNKPVTIFMGNRKENEKQYP